jgi:hypothetical protein
MYRWWLPLIFALWVNLHGGWIVGAGILGALVRPGARRRCDHASIAVDFARCSTVVRRGDACQSIWRQRVGIHRYDRSTVAARHRRVAASLAAADRCMSMAPHDDLGGTGSAPGAGIASGGNRNRCLSRLCIPVRAQAGASVRSRLDHPLASVRAIARWWRASLAERADCCRFRIYLCCWSSAGVASLDRLHSDAGGSRTLSRPGRSRSRIRRDAWRPRSTGASMRSGTSDRAQECQSMAEEKRSTAISS